MIKMTILGNLGKDSEIKHFGDDKLSVVNFSVAHTESRKNKDGVKEQTTIWANCAWWLKREVAEKVAPYLKKGKKVYVEGEPGARGYVPNTGGDARGELTLRVYSLEFADGAKEGDTNTSSAQTSNTVSAPVNSATQAPGYNPAPVEEDDLPF